MNRYKKRRRETLELFCDDLKLSKNAKEKACEFLQTIEKKFNFNGKGPKCVAGIAYMASILNHESRTQKQVSDVSELTESTIRKYYQQFNKILGARI